MFIFDWREIRGLDFQIVCSLKYSRKISSSLSIFLIFIVIAFNPEFNADHKYVYNLSQCKKHRLESKLYETVFETTIFAINRYK